ncbi:hypothetical protein BC826DRAFT_1008301 [Russula brevipes]|nr:hypothetical protein BC826DRAFT_1008301 [Russula brevipes]
MNAQIASTGESGENGLMPAPDDIDRAGANVGANDPRQEAMQAAARGLIDLLLVAVGDSWISNHPKLVNTVAAALMIGSGIMILYGLGSDGYSLLVTIGGIILLFALGLKALLKSAPSPATGDASQPSGSEGV